ncbi:HNH endonuclease family protein [Demequina sp. B12]|uniref:HNH endonuclease family protein n=1 Tax=Demequina sp. B12 TaxID=2992757 RepID=UPI00237A1941|nr:HNH endonuclease family protein [Demequina sp. B12]MDE0572881.1 HNH endonuclease family protein [Demequina sp. B12]
MNGGSTGNGADFLGNPDAGADNPLDEPVRLPRARPPWLKTVVVIAVTSILAGGIGYTLGQTSGMRPTSSGPERPSSPVTVTVTAEPDAKGSPDVPETAESAQDRAALATSPAATEAAAPTAVPTEGESAEKSTVSRYLELLDGLEVRSLDPWNNYSRELFGRAWEDVDRNGCDTRNDILRRDLEDIVVRSGTGGCVVATGRLEDPYTGKTIAFERGWGTSNAVEIDHVVAMADAWRKGAQSWTAHDRELFANDPLNLLAVDGPTNQVKGASDPSQWLPPHQEYWCDYGARIVAVKSIYGLWVTREEAETLEELLMTCDADPQVIT